MRTWIIYFHRIPYWIQDLREYGFLAIRTHQKIEGSDKSYLNLCIYTLFFVGIIFPIFSQNLDIYKYYHIKNTDKYIEMYVAKEYALLRSNPTNYAFEVAVLKKGEKVKVVYQPKERQTSSSIQEWYFIITEKGYLGWIHSSFLSKTDPIREENEQLSMYIISKELSGTWWEVDEFNSIGFRKFEFQIDHSNREKGTFIYSFKDTPKIEGNFEIKKNGIIVLDKNLSIGNALTIIKNSDGYRIILEHNNKKYYFKKSKMGNS